MTTVRRTVATALAAAVVAGGPGCARRRPSQRTTLASGPTRYAHLSARRVAKNDLVSPGS
ncbi:MAG: hypothetical protein LC635_05275 [Pseudonocardiaceae bacterium]|nr:hypothetical protein [Pseudonocardiaceae bacterium]